MAVFRNAQGFSLGCAASGNIAPAAVTTLQGTAQVPLLLEDLIIDSSQSVGAAVTAIRVAGQNIMASNQSCPTFAFSNQAQVEGGWRSLSLTLDQSQTLAIDVTNNAGAGVAAVNASFQFSCSTTPIAQADVIPTSQSGDALNYVFGFGTAALAAPIGSQATLNATALRPTVLGKLIACVEDVAGGTQPFGAVADNIEITSIQVNNIELLSGAAADAIPLSAVGVGSTDISAGLLSYPVELNSQVTLQFRVHSAPLAGAVVVSAMAYCLPRATL